MRLSALYNIYSIKTLLENLSKKLRDLWIKCADRTSIIIRQVIEFRAWFDPVMGFPPCLVVNIAAHRTDVFGGLPLLKPPRSDFSLPLVATDGTHVGVGKVIKLRPFRDPVMRFTTQR